MLARKAAYAGAMRSWRRDHPGRLSCRCRHSARAAAHPVTNLAIGGSKAIEAYAALACASPPKLVILSFDPSHFTRPDLFWERSIRFGFLSASDVEALRTASHGIGDTSVYEARHADGLPSILRDKLYQLRFPPFYAASLIHGGFVLRWPGNQVRLHRPWPPAASTISAPRQGQASSPSRAPWRRSAHCPSWTCISTGCWR